MDSDITCCLTTHFLDVGHNQCHIRLVFDRLNCVTGAGADFVMLGGMLAGHSESGGEIIEKNGKKYKLFYGMSSDTAMKKHSGGVAEYR